MTDVQLEKRARELDEQVGRMRAAAERERLVPIGLVMNPTDYVAIEHAADAHRRQYNFSARQAHEVVELGGLRIDVVPGILKPRLVVE